MAALPRLSSSLLAFLATGILLSGCGSDDDTPIATNASTGGGEAVSPSDSGSTSNSAGVGYLFASLNVADAQGATTGQRLAIVDGDTGTLLKTISVNADSTQLLAQAFTVSADGSVARVGRNVALYYTQGGKLFEAGLVAPVSPGDGRQVSSEAHACRLVQAIAQDTTAAASWLLFTTAGADGDCGTTADNRLALVSSQADAATAAKPLGFDAGQILGVRRDAQGRLLNVIAYVTTTVTSTTDGETHTRTASLTLVSVSAAGVVSELPVAPDATGTVPSVSLLSKVPGSSDLFVLVGEQIRRLTVAADGQLSLGALPSSAARVLPGYLPFVQADGQAVYFVAAEPNGTDTGAAVVALKALYADGSLKTLVPLDSAAEVQPGGVLTASSVLLTLRQGDVYSLMAVRKSDGARNGVDWPGNTQGPVRVEAVRGDVAVLSQTGSGGQRVALLRLTAEVQAPAAGGVATLTAAPLTGASQARVIAKVQDATRGTGGEAQIAQLIWCDATTACTPANAKSYALQDGGMLSLAGTGTGGAAWDATRALATDMTRGLFTASTATQAGDQGGGWSTDSLWLFEATRAGSLSEIATTTGQ